MKRSRTSTSLRTTILMSSLFAVSACASVSGTFAPLSEEQTAALRETCGSIPISLLKSSANLKRIRYSECKRETLAQLEDEADAPS